MPDALEHMAAYYQARAPIYDRVYAYPERQADLRELEGFVQSYFASRKVLEVAAGTGYWSQFIGRTAVHLLATDINPGPLQELRNRDLSLPIDTVVADGYTLAEVTGEYDAAFAGCWFSHVPISARADWFANLHNKLQAGAKVLLLDNSHAQTQRLPLVDEDSDGNTYQMRTLDSGESYRVIKNFPSAQEMRSLVGDADAEFRSMAHYWSFAYTIPSSMN